jgi:hypothetical protein
MERQGGCACGAIRFRITAPVLGVGACHCSDCRKMSGGGPNYVALVPVPALEILQGEATIFRSKGDSGADIGRAFCADCGTPLWSVPANEPFVTVKLGALDDCSDLAPQMHIYTASAPAWHQIPDDLPTFPKMPPPMSSR